MQIPKTVYNLDRVDTSSAHQKLELIRKIESAGGELIVLLGSHYIFHPGMKDAQAVWEPYPLTYDTTSDQFYIIKRDVDPQYNNNKVYVFADGQVRTSFFYVGWKLR